MAQRPAKPCAYHRCPRLVRGTRYCDEHKSQENSHRDPEARRLYDRKWKSARAAYLAENPLCVECLAEGRYVSATVVDHIQDHKGDRGLFWNPDNWQAMCKRHHDAKTMRENPVRCGSSVRARM